MLDIVRFTELDKYDWAFAQSYFRSIIFNKVDELTKKLPIKIVDKFDKIKTGYDEDKIRKALIKDLDMALYNQRHIPIYTHRIKD